MTVVVGSFSIWQAGFLALWMFGMKCAAMDFTPLGKLIGDAVLKAMVDEDITVKAAAATGGMDESTFRKALRGESYRHITLIHMAKLGPKFWVRLSASIMWLVAKQHLEEILETVNVRKGA